MGTGVEVGVGRATPIIESLGVAVAVGSSVGVGSAVAVGVGARIGIGIAVALAVAIAAVGAGEIGAVVGTLVAVGSAPQATARRLRNPKNSPRIIGLKSMTIF